MRVTTHALQLMSNSNKIKKKNVPNFLHYVKGNFFNNWEFTSSSVLFKADGQMFVCPAIGRSKSASCWQCAA